MGKVRGTAKLTKQLLSLAPAIKAALEASVLKGAQDVAATARALVPVDSGDLKASIGAVLGDAPATAATQAIRGSVGSKDGIVKATAYAGDDKAFYAAWVEFGTQGGNAGQRVGSAGAGDKQAKRGRKSYRSHGGTAAQPFFFTAYRSNKKRAASRNTRAINKAIKGAAGK